MAKYTGAVPKPTYEEITVARADYNRYTVKLEGYSEDRMRAIVQFIEAMRRDVEITLTRTTYSGRTDEVISDETLAHVCGDW